MQTIRNNTPGPHVSALYFPFPRSSRASPQQAAELLRLALQRRPRRGAVVKHVARRTYLPRLETERWRHFMSMLSQQPATTLRVRVRVRVGVGVRVRVRVAWISAGSPPCHSLACSGQTRVPDCPAAAFQPGARSTRAAHVDTQGTSTEEVGTRHLPRRLWSLGLGG